MSALALGKVAAIERSVLRAREEFGAAGADFTSDLTRQDAAISISCVPAKPRSTSPTS